MSQRTPGPKNVGPAGRHTRPGRPHMRTSVTAFGGAGPPKERTPVLTLTSAYAGPEKRGPGGTPYTAWPAAYADVGHRLRRGGPAERANPFTALRPSRGRLPGPGGCRAPASRPAWPSAG